MVCNELVDKWNPTHLVPADHPSKQYQDSQMEGDERGWKMGGRKEIHCMDHNKMS